MCTWDLREYLIISRYLADNIFQCDTVIIAMSTTTTTVGNDGGGYEDFVVIDESRWALGCWVVALELRD